MPSRSSGSHTGKKPVYVSMAEATRLFDATPDAVRVAANEDRIGVELSELPEGDLIRYALDDLKREFYLREDPRDERSKELAAYVKGGIIGTVIGKVLDLPGSLFPERRRRTEETAESPSRRDFLTRPFQSSQAKPALVEVDVQITLSRMGEEVFRKHFGRHDGPRPLSALRRSIGRVVTAGHSIFVEFHEDLDLFLMPALPSRALLVGDPVFKADFRLPLPPVHGGAAPNAALGAYWSRPVQVRDQAILELDGELAEIDLASATLSIGLGFIDRFGTAAVADTLSGDALQAIWDARSELRGRRAQ